MASPASSSTPTPSTKNKKKKYIEDDNSDTPIDFGKYLIYLFPVGVFSGMVAWWKNSDSNIIMRIIYVLIAYLFNILYLIYSVYRWFTYRPQPTS